MGDERGASVAAAALGRWKVARRPAWAEATRTEASSVPRFEQVLLLPRMMGESAGMRAVARMATQVTSRPDWTEVRPLPPARTMSAVLHPADVRPGAATSAHWARPARPCLQDWSDQRRERALPAWVPP